MHTYRYIYTHIYIYICIRSRRIGILNSTSLSPDACSSSLPLLIFCRSHQPPEPESPQSQDPKLPIPSSHRSVQMNRISRRLEEEKDKTEQADRKRERERDRDRDRDRDTDTHKHAGERERERGENTRRAKTSNRERERKQKRESGCFRVSF